MRLYAAIAAMVGALLFATNACAADLCANPRQMDGFKTCADVEKAEREGKLILYATDPESATEQVLARILAERQSGVFTAAAQLFLDWFLSLPGQSANVKYQFTQSLRPDAPAPPGGVQVTAFKLLVPDDWHALEASHLAYVKEWNKLTGMR